ncbi:type IV secretion protein Rhs, partial [Kibdelosporangium lantanae]
MTSISTQVYDGSYKDVDSWAFNQTYPDPLDKSSPALWLASIKHTGLAGTKVELPAVSLVGTTYANRVDLDSDGLPKMNKYRLTAINTESGGTISTDYMGADCNPTAKPNPADNGTRCYPVRWTPNLGNTRDDWFVKYVAYQVSQLDRVGKTDKQVTTYDYEGAGAWAYDDDPLVQPEHRSWTRWRGYENVRVRKGDPADKDNPQSDTRYHYFRGMNGDRKTTTGGTKGVKIKDSRGVEVVDDDWLAGTVLETTVYNGYTNGVDGPVISSTITESSVQGPTATAGSLKAYYVRPGTTVERTAVTGGWRTTKKTVSYDKYGKETQTEDLGDIDKSDDDQCVTTTYARNTGGDTYLIDPVSRVEKIGLPCGKPPVTGDDVVSDTKTSYDGGAWGDAPTAGSVTQVREISSFNNTLDRGYVADKTIDVDAYGRPKSVTDANKNVTKTVYSPEIGLTRTITETNPANHVKVTSLNVVISQPVSIVDANGQTTNLEYDALGRLTAVWLPGRKKGSVGGPNVKYTYAVHNDAPTVVTTAKLRPNLTAPVEYALFDGFMRPRQMQQPTSIGGRMVTDTLYDSRGLVSR